MPTAIVFDSDDKEYHYSHPDEDGETFCGQDWNHDSEYFVGSFGVSSTSFVEDIMWASGRKSGPDDDVQRTPCDECETAGTEWATPEDEK